MASLNSHTKDLSNFWKGKILWNRPMSQYSTLKVGGPAKAVISVIDIEELGRLIKWLRENDINWWVIGRGSNILVSDQGLSGVVIVLEEQFSSIEIADPGQKIQTGQNVLIRTGSACLLSKAVLFCTANSLSGLEFAVGIPGSIGGAVVMNAGAWGQEIGNLVDSATLMDNNGVIFTRQGAELGFTYRGSGVKSNTVLLCADLLLTAGRREEIKVSCRRYQELRKKKQPLSKASAGSFFKNPPELSAGHLIDEAGLKGHAIGGAKISEKHANFIINKGNASATEILALMHLVQDTVYKRFGVQLEPEVRILGEEG